MASTSWVGTSSRSATKCRNRAESSIPAWPMTRDLGSSEATAARAVISSSGLDTTMSTVSGDASTSRRVTSATILALVSSRSIRLIPGLRGTPAVITQMSEPAVSS